MRHAVFHGALIRPGIVFAPFHQYPPAFVHALGNFVVFNSCFHVGSLFSLDKFAFKQANFLRVIKLNHVQCFLRPLGVQRGHDEHMWIPLHHDVRVHAKPDCAVFWVNAIAEFLHGIVPLPVHGCAGSAQTSLHTNGLNTPVVTVVPLQIRAADKLTQAWMEGLDVVVLQVNLNEGFPVVRQHIAFDGIKLETGKINFFQKWDILQFVQHIAA